jgi:chitinase
MHDSIFSLGRLALLVAATIVLADNAPADEDFEAHNATINIQDIHQGHALPEIHLARSEEEIPQKPLAKDGAAPCSTIQVVSGDTCATLAARCQISAADFTKYNPRSTLCSSLAIGQYICCSAGPLPDLTPRPAADGSCFSYSVQPGDYCAKIAAEHQTTTANIEAANQQTWGWSGCKGLQGGQAICLSTGTPPMPAAAPGAVCGPQVPGTVRPKGNLPLASLNPCPLNACCNIWGQCGTTDSFCTITGTGPPGTAAPGTNGCISNCGTAIVNNEYQPVEFKRIGYFESWSVERKCLKMDASQIRTEAYTHIHFAFGSITPDYRVDIGNSKYQFSNFLSLNGVKKVLSFGGWSFSTEQDSYPIFRDGVTEADRQTFATNVVSFVKQYNLDGVDFDWEYPGAPDIPGIPAGGPNDGKNYLSFLKLVRAALPAGKSVSIAAPASYWYLKGFPIKEISDVVDYIIYMTYDLHGQWDYGNVWSQTGCPSSNGVAGNCLRSHVNLTETMNALSMVTKAGVQARKIMVGISSYGRGFQMEDPNCMTDTCRFTKEPAAPGACTNEPGYIANAEIDEILRTNPTAKRLMWHESDTNILVYNSNQWVAYMDAVTKAKRITKYRDLNFGGTSDWAIDLEVQPIEPCGETFDSLEALSLAVTADTGPGRPGQMPFKPVPTHCINQYAISIESKTIKSVLEGYSAILNQGYDEKFQVYERYIRDLVPSQLGWYMAANASDLFTCTIKRRVQCCKDCSSGFGCEGCDTSTGCVSGWQDKAAPCPDFYPSPLDLKDLERRKVRYSFKLNKEKEFYDGIMAAYGIQKGWVKFGSLLALPDPSCWGSSGPCESNYYWEGYPLAGDITIINPKDLLSSASSKVSDLQRMLARAEINSQFLHHGENCDVIYGATIPVFMARAALRAMEQVKSTGEQVEAETQKQMISSFIEGSLLILSFAGGFAAKPFSKIIEWVEPFAGWTWTTYNLVDKPEDWFKTLFGQITGIPTDEPFKGAATVWKEIPISDSGVALALGKGVAEAVSQVSRMLQKSCPAS